MSDKSWELRNAQTDTPILSIWDEDVAELASNTTDGLEPRFLSRCRVLEFSTYGMSDAICAHLERVWHSEGGNGDCPNLKRLCADTHKNVRESLMRLELELMEREP
jgi:hypothetical protein